MASDHHVPWRARKVMLLKAKLLTVDVFVVRDTGACKGFRQRFWLPRYLVIPAVEPPRQKDSVALDFRRRSVFAMPERFR